MKPTAALRTSRITVQNRSSTPPHSRSVTGWSSFPTVRVDRPVRSSQRPSRSYQSIPISVASVGVFAGRLSARTAEATAAAKFRPQMCTVTAFSPRLRCTTHQSWGRLHIVTSCSPTRLPPCRVARNCNFRLHVDALRVCRRLRQRSALLRRCDLRRRRTLYQSDASRRHHTQARERRARQALVWVGASRETERRSRQAHTAKRGSLLTQRRRAGRLAPRYD